MENKLIVEANLSLSVEMPDDIPDQELVPAHGGPFR